MNNTERMTPQAAAQILSAQCHRSEAKWWVETRQEFYQGSERVVSIVVNSASMQFHPFEAIAIAQAYSVHSHPQPTIVSAHEITHLLPALSRL